ncbi:hypothetical protein SASPL_143495 [Salvia splendens]|uniref:Cyclin-like domain-containing protein n=1 Tax=Salvia splendens TaxID=180675 RepID=A0A8X8WNS0_SALSN|nr:hypothetical protein SASPL_143495 [Salvia splendens]
MDFLVEAKNHIADARSLSPYCKTAPALSLTTSHSLIKSYEEMRIFSYFVLERHSLSTHEAHTCANNLPILEVVFCFAQLRAEHNRVRIVQPRAPSGDEDPFEPTGFITAFSTWSLEPYPVFALSSLSFAGHLAELERVLETTSQGTASGPSVVVDNLRAYLQIVDVASILGLDCDISDHAFQLFRDCSSATCLRNRSVEALATAALVQAIREAQEPRTLQEISSAANLPQKEIGKYIKILGEALQLSQPINSNSISVHMPRFCMLLQLNKSAQELATHIGEVVINKCFCTRRNPISISAAAIYLACQLEDKCKTQAEICKVTGLTEVTLRKVYKELLENWDDLLPSNYNPVVPPEKAFPTATISSGRLSSSRGDLVEGTPLEKHTGIQNPLKQPTTKQYLGHHSGSPRLDTDATAASSSRRHVQFPSPPALAADRGCSGGRGGPAWVHYLLVRSNTETELLNFADQLLPI